ncbi:MAG: tetratricopeptide repeat protein, partial [Candidatus Hydrothermales bacterium]
LENQTEKIDKYLLTITIEEITDFLNHHKINYNKKDIHNIISKTKGHGLFTRILLSEYLNKKTVPEKLESEYIEKILKEKLNELEPVKRSLLLGLSCLERFKKDELEKILGLKNPENFIKEITEKFLFIEKSGEYYFLNPIFKEFLLKELEKNPKGLILKKWILDNAVEYYLEKEDFFQALSYLLKLKYYSKILDVLNKKIYDILDTTIFYEIEPIVEKLPEELQKNFLIILIKAEIHYLSYRFEETLKELEKIDVSKLEPEYRGLFFFLKGGSFYYLSNYKEAEKFAYEGLLYKDKLENRILYRLNTLLGAVSSANEELEKAEKFYNEALNIAKNIRITKRGVALLLTNIGVVYFKRLKLEIAEEKYKEALSIAVDEDLITYILGMLSWSYLYTGDKEKLLTTLEEMKTYIEKSRTYYYYDNYYFLLKNYYILIGDIEKAKDCNSKLRELYEEYKDPDTLLDVMLFDSSYELIKGNVQKALNIAKSIQPHSEIFECDKNILLAKIFLVLGEVEKTEEYFRKSLEKCHKSPLREISYYIQYFLFLFYMKDLERASEEIKKVVKKFSDLNHFFYNLRYEINIFPLPIKEEEIINFLKEQKII